MKALLAMFVILGAGCTTQSMEPINHDFAQLADDLAMPACPNDLPSACPSTPPSWMTTVEPIVSGRCQSCHVPGGVASTVLLTSYAQVHARASTVLDQIFGCLMPPPDGHDLQATERAALLAWLVCGAPNN